MHTKQDATNLSMQFIHYDHLTLTFNSVISKADHNNVLHCKTLEYIPNSSSSKYAKFAWQDMLASRP